MVTITTSDYNNQMLKGPEVPRTYHCSEMIDIKMKVQAKTRGKKKRPEKILGTWRKRRKKMGEKMMKAKE